MNEKLKYGAKMIDEAKLIGVNNPSENRDYVISFSIPEFTCLCPMSNFPDFATIHIQYVPKERIVELKSLKLYINRFRNEEHFHEEVVNLILDDFLICCEPKWVKIEGDFNVRGNIKTKVRVINGVKPPNCD
ncbi:MAG: NADPH-dependent 7-cyano-7-deazaguanine reductase QueF [Nitrospinae bacterium]|nr:NADPH-dependent 7-cyano-7-deazaguanine reductase QueF [Nitrospinota bacterium]|tara:strand:+ start:3999 stop:4394 length:396 start_codon:yes stop_codon:yes gene_type:complete